MSLELFTEEEVRTLAWDMAGGVDIKSEDTKDNEYVFTDQELKE